jgi:type II secretory pathway component PulF
MTCVVPKFEELFVSFGQDLPWITRLLLGLSRWFAAFWWLALLGGAGALFGATWLLRQSAVRLRVDRTVLRFPVAGRVIMKLEVSRIAQTLGALLDSGIGMIAALRITGQTARNRAVGQVFSSVIERVGHGDTLATALVQCGLFPPMVLSLVQTGEDSGQLPEMLAELAQIYEDESERAITGAVRLLEPLLIVVMGGVIAGIVAAVMLPIFRANALVT